MDDLADTIPDWRKDLARMLTVIGVGTLILCLVCACIIKQRGLSMKGICKCCLEDDMDYEPTSEHESIHRKKSRRTEVRVDPFPANRIRMEHRIRKWRGSDTGTTSPVDDDDDDDDSDDADDEDERKGT